MIEQIHAAVGVPPPEEPASHPGVAHGIPGEEDMEEDIQVEED